jgi:hypothetical protein
MRFPTPNIKIRQVFALVDGDLAALFVGNRRSKFCAIAQRPLKIIIIVRPVKIPRTNRDRECRAERKLYDILVDRCSRVYYAACDLVLICVRGGRGSIEDVPSVSSNSTPVLLGSLIAGIPGPTFPTDRIGKGERCSEQ